MSAMLGDIAQLDQCVETASSRSWGKVGDFCDFAQSHLRSFVTKRPKHGKSSLQRKQVFAINLAVVWRSMGIDRPRLTGRFVVRRE